MLIFIHNVSKRPKKLYKIILKFSLVKSPQNLMYLLTLEANIIHNGELFIFESDVQKCLIYF